MQSSDHGNPARAQGCVMKEQLKPGASLMNQQYLVLTGQSPIQEGANCFFCSSGVPATPIINLAGNLPLLRANIVWDGIYISSHPLAVRLYDGPVRQVFVAVQK